MFECNICGVKFHESDQNRNQQRNGLCPSCEYEDIRDIPDILLSCHEKMGNSRLPPEQWQCEAHECAKWSIYFGMCGDAVPAYLNGLERKKAEALDHRRFDRPMGDS